MGASSPCHCVLRAIFRACYNRFRLCVNKEKHMTRVSLEHTGSGGGRRYMWSRKDEEYIADFSLVSKRTLTPAEYRLFNYHFLLGADWKLCCRKLKIDRGTFFHAVYRIQAKLGQVFRELQPYGLYPLDEYFGSSRLLEPIQVAATAPPAPPKPEPGKVLVWRAVPRTPPPSQPLRRVA
jgi:hypothetical protein